MITSIPQCLECYYYIKYDGINFNCEAFRKGPDNVFDNTIKHNKIIEGQIGNYIFKPKLII